MQKLTDFLNEISDHRRLKPEDQTVYNCYEKKREFYAKLEEMQYSGIIRLHENNGTTLIELTAYGDLLRIMLNHILKKKDGFFDVLKP